MQYIFNFPDIGEGLDEGTIAEWYVVKGQQIRSGDALVRMETDKVVTDIPSPKTGTIVAVYGKPGDVVHVGSPLVEIEIEGVFGKEAIEEVKKEIQTMAIDEGPAGVVGTIEIAGNNAYLPASDEGVIPEKKEIIKKQKKVLATPVARAMAKEMNIDINEVSGTGTDGRVMSGDIQKYSVTNKKAIPSKVTLPLDPVSEEDTYENLSQIRKTIARNMAASKRNAVHMTVHEEIDIAELIRIREKYKTIYEQKNIKLTYLPFIIKATAKALQQHKVLNAQLDLENNRIIYKNAINIGFAADTAEGLVVPVIRNADKLSISEIALQLQELTEKAKNRKITVDDMKNGTFTITNYGSIGGIFASPVINYPQSGILGVGRILKKPVVKNDQIVIGNILPVSLAVDHRIVDGGEVTRFLKKIIGYLEDPVSLMME
jgi:pyruvate dehydrogenase E2 component (dihydrolipoamide acetyltransferase)